MDAVLEYFQAGTQFKAQGFPSAIFIPIFKGRIPALFKYKKLQRKEKEKDMKKTRKLGHKVLTLLMALAIVFTTIPVGIMTGTVNTADAATKGTLKQINLTNYALKSNKYMEIRLADYQNGKTAIGSCTESGMQLHHFSIGGVLVFCMEHGVVQKEVTLKAVERDDSSFAKAYKNDGYSYAIDNMFSVIFYAPTEQSDKWELINDLGFKNSTFYGQNGDASTYTTGSWIAATQMLVWECQQLMRDKDFNRVSNGLYYQTSWRGPTTTPISKSHYTTNLVGTPAIDIYNFIAAKVKANNNFDRNIASANKNKPKQIAIPDDATFPYTTTFSAGSYAGDYKVYDSKNREVEDVIINYDAFTKEYTLTVNSAAVLNQTLKIKHDDAAAKRAAKYLNGPNGKDYEQYFWEYETTSGHTQGFISGLNDPAEGFLKLTKDTPTPEEGDCTPPDVDYFPTVYMPVEKIDLNEGFDVDQHTPMGDAGLDATYTLERSINGGTWETIDVITLDDYGTEYVFQDQPFLTVSDLSAYMTESGSISGCSSHPIYDGEGNVTDYEHQGMSKSPAKRVWNVTVDYRITESRPDGRYIDPDRYAGKREYSLTYYAETHDTCTQYCDSLPWTEVKYIFTYGATTGDGTMKTEGASISPSEELSCDLETFVNDVQRGDIQIIKSNEKENPFKDSTLGGSDSNISQNSLWTIRLESKGFENSEYIHLASGTPVVLSGGTHQYTVSRDAGAVVNDETNPMKVGTNGTLVVKDVPYGTYIVTEVSADDPKYVLEQFKVVVGEHNGNGGAPVNQTGLFAGYGTAGTNSIGSTALGTGDYYNNRYDVNLRDKIKSNVIKLEKVDSETGKPIPLAGTKVYIRYKGNPDYTDAENQQMFGPAGTVAKNIYNRFLPNAESINSKSTDYTFELDENGELKIPYQLPYGKYEIYEWLLPEGYYVGQYDETGKGTSHDFGYIEEGEFKLGDLDGDRSLEANVAIYNADGNKVIYHDKDEYKFDELKNMVTNTYTFTVTEQDIHVDGNFSQLVTCNGNVSDADPDYDKGDYPYPNYYKVAAVINNAVKGKIEITKEGEALVGFVKKEKDGYTVFTPVFEAVTKLKDAVFGIFAAKDENLNDGSEGPEIYDSKTNELITIPKEISTHLSNAVESVKAFFGKLLNPKEYSAANYETGAYSHESGGELWYMLEREASEGNVKRTIYVSPEQKDTVYSYAYETTDGQFNYRWDVEVVMKNQAGGRNITDINVTKTTSAAAGYVTDIPLTKMTGTVGDTVLDPISNYMPITDPDSPDSWKSASKLEAYSRTYVFEADGKTLSYADGTKFKDDIYIYDDEESVDLSKFCPDRYLVRDYVYYTLTKDDLKTEERVVGQQEDVKETKPMFEWDNPGYVLVSPKTAGSKAVLKSETTGLYKAAVKGYYTEGNYTSLIAGGADYAFIDSDDSGEPIAEYTVPAGWTLKAFTGDPKEDPQYVIIYQTNAETGETVYRVLLDDLINWQECTPEGNFVKAAVQVYQIKYTQEAGDPNGFTVNFDGFALGSNADAATNIAATVITKQNNPVSNEVIDVGAGYEYKDAGDTITFTTIPITAPIYFAWADSIKADMYYKGGACYTTISMPASAVDHLYDNIVPTLNFIHFDSDGDKIPLFLDWYSKLTPENPAVEFGTRDGLPDGVTVVAKRVDSTAVGGQTMYYLEIITNQTEDAPLEITFADGYTMAIYCAEAASGNNVGVLDLYNVYKTNRYTQSDIIEVITTNEDGIATSGLLPLGDYIVRELSADDNYLNDSEEQLVTLKYKDQFTPVIWGAASFDNEYMSVQIDLSKVFETSFRSDAYQPPEEGQTVKFGLYTAEDITVTAVGRHEVTKKTIKADTLIDVISVDYTTGGSVLADAKLPEGSYYIRELEGPEDYLLSDVRFNFEVREDDADYSSDAAFDYTINDGIYGRFVLEEKNHVKTTIMVESRLPMPSITIDGSVYPLDTDFASEDGRVSIDADSDFTEVTVDTFADAQTNIILPNGKTLKVKLGETGNTFDYTVDGVKNTFTPTVTYTGYYAGYEELWTPIAGEDLTTYTPEFTMTGAGSDKTSVILSAKVTHEPSEGLTPGGNQIFKHSAVITVKDDGDANVISGNYERTSGNTTVTETLDSSGEIIINPEDTLKLKTASGAGVTVSMDKYGVVTAAIENVLTGLFTDAANSEVASTGGFDTAQTFEFTKNVTLARQDTSADKLMIKINSDNRDGFAVENDHKPEIEFVKVDREDPAKKLSGAVFEVYSAKPSGQWTYEPDQLLGTYTTGSDGTFAAVLDYGTYFWHEIKAPSGYKADDYDYHRFRVIKGLPQYQFVVENDRVPVTPGGGEKYLFEITKSDMETGETLAGAEFEIYGSAIIDGTAVRNEEPLLKGLVTGSYGKLTISLDTAGTYFYHEVKAPAGYKCDGEYYAVEIKNGTVVTKVTMVNEKLPEEPIKPPARPKKPDIPGKPELPSDVPETGDKYQLSLWILLAVISMSAFFAALQRKEN